MNSLLILTGIIMILPFTISHAQIEPDPSQPVGPTTNIDDLNRGHNIITQLMTDHADGNFERFEDQIINLAFVDPDNGTLVVGFDPIMHVLDIQPNTGDLLTGIPTDIVYSIHELLSDDQDPIQRYHDLYEHRCTNSLSVLCEKLAYQLNINQYQDQYIPTVPNISVIFSDNFENGLKKWIKSGDSNFKAKISDESERYPTIWSPNNTVLESGKCGNGCLISLKRSIDLTTYNNISLSFNLYIDDLSTNQYLQLDFYNGTNWNTVKRWTQSTNNTWITSQFILNDHKSNTFNLRFTADSGKNKEIAIDNLVIIGELDSDRDGIINIHDKCPRMSGLVKLKGCPDTEPPKFYNDLRLPGKYKHIQDDKFFYPIIAVDSIDGVVDMNCEPPNGSVNNGLRLSLDNYVIRYNCNAIDSNGNNNHQFLSTTVKRIQSADLYGGTVHGVNLYYVDDENVKGAKGTITIGAITNDGTKGIVVAGHSIGYNINAKYFKPEHQMDHFIINDNKYIQINYGPAIDSKSFSVDAAFIPLQTKVDINPYQVKMKNGTVFNVTQSSMAETPRISKINVYGHLTNDQGILLFKNVTVRSVFSAYSNMGAFTADVIHGDSGGPIIYHNDGKNKLIGSIHGSTCIIYNIPNELISIYSLNCISFNPPYIRIFTPWEHIKDDLNIK